MVARWNIVQPIRYRHDPNQMWECYITFLCRNFSQTTRLSKRRLQTLSCASDSLSVKPLMTVMDVILPSKWGNSSQTHTIVCFHITSYFPIHFLFIVLPFLSLPLSTFLPFTASSPLSPSPLPPLSSPAARDDGLSDWASPDSQRFPAQVSHPASHVWPRTGQCQAHLWPAGGPRPDTLWACHQQEHAVRSWCAQVDSGTEGENHPEHGETADAKPWVGKGLNLLVVHW